MYDRHPRQTWVDVDLAQLGRNIATLRGLHPQAKGLLVVKANAYGHGIVEVSRHAQGLVDCLGVANVSEGLLLREHGIGAALLAMGYVSAEEMPYAVEAGIDVFAWMPEQLQTLSSLAGRQGKPARVHLKVDIGMGRLGAPAAQIEALARRARELPHLQVVGLATHFPKADIVGDPDTEAQLARFRTLVQALEGQQLRPALVHCANSPATLRFADAGFTMVRMGIAAYGLQPDADVALRPGMAPVLSWKARLGPCRRFAAGTPLSYGGEYRTADGEVIAPAPLGYADGFRRTPRGVNTMLVGGVEAAVVGRVCMDQCLVRIPPSVVPETGLEATLIGRSGGAGISADDLATRWGTNNYDVICGIDVRVPRRYHTQ